jgi:DNA-binding response OmpR family regulator
LPPNWLRVCTPYCAGKVVQSVPCWLSRPRSESRVSRSATHRPFHRLSPKKYALLEYLLLQFRVARPRASIVQDVWRVPGDSLTNVVEVYINYLRRKIDAGSDRPLIRTIRGVGYQMVGIIWRGELSLR